MMHLRGPEIERVLYEHGTVHEAASMDLADERPVAVVALRRDDSLSQEEFSRPVRRLQDAETPLVQGTGLRLG